MAMRFTRPWDFNPGNKQLDLNSLTQDTEVVEALREALELAAGAGVASEVTVEPFGTIEATNVQAALEELLAEGGSGGGGEAGPPGEDGKSAYEIALDNGFVGSEFEWLSSLQGTDGTDGTNGINGTNGTNGTDGDDGADGAPGAILLEVGGDAGDVPGGTPVGTIVYVKSA